MDNIKLKELERYVKKFLTNLQDNVIEKSDKIHLLRHTIQTNYFYPEYTKLDLLEEQCKKKYGELFNHFKYEDNKKWETRGEIESQIYSNNEHYNLRVKLSEQKYIVKELEAILLNLKDCSYSIKNIIDYKKWESGMF